MPINFQQVYSQIATFAANASAREEELQRRRQWARVLLERYAAELDFLRRRVQETLATETDVRCAVPVDEPLTARHPLPPLPAGVTLLAADGSQIAPDRHAPVLFGLINIGIIYLRHSSGDVPQVFNESRLLLDQELYTPQGRLISEGMLALQRDLQERRLLAEQARLAEKPVIALTDGPLELWGIKEAEESGSYRKALDEYLTLLKELASDEIVAAGYVDKPTADLVVRLLELVADDVGERNSIANKAEWRKEIATRDTTYAKEHRPLLGVSDRWLFGERENPLLRAGERSAIFALQSRSGEFYRDELALHFFYLNVGDDLHPWPVRVEIPAWVARRPTLVDVLHAALVEQCRLMGKRPFPYLLHRAHELAVIGQVEKEQVETLLALELRKQGMEMDEQSPKQSAKEGARRE